MKKIWTDSAWDDYVQLQYGNKIMLKKINQLIKAIDRNGTHGIGQTELLKGDLNGFLSKRIDKTNRFVFRISELGLEIAQVSTHYKRM